ncbi:hypothetical protein HDE76_001481 [Rhodanobacter sp. ANJX3]|jgi:hypothetical protein|uniref:hypothetical protein n=1 Tax=Rhodanobacter sp. ANJX3 TaxID=2723083 RepID=UPI001618BD6F|nr:hypothetical protein [Rhodanobacter sp. ANJX3]MBB5358275.1 hypothetical protein [Rhodanobacter sp. ANJX3]
MTDVKLTYVITYTQGSGPNQQTIRGCRSQAEAEETFWSQSHIKNNPKTAIVSIKSNPG